MTLTTASVLVLKAIIVLSSYFLQTQSTTAENLASHVPDYQPAAFWLSAATETLKNF
jgi:hypothetical protein